MRILLLAICLLATAPASAQAINSHRTAIELQAAALERFTGVYEVAEIPNFPFKLSVRDGFLVVNTPLVEADRIYPETATRFFSKTIEAVMTFTLDAEGRVTGVIFDQPIGTFVGKKTG